MELSTSELILLIASCLLTYVQSDNPFLEVGPQNQSVFIGTDIELVCDIVDDANLDIIWRFVPNDVWLTRNGQVFPNIGAMYQRVTIDVEFSTKRYVLGVYDIHISDSGAYQCGYMSDIGTFIEITQVHVVVVDPASTPDCKVVALPSLSGVQGDEVDVTCSWSVDLVDARAVITRNGQTVEPDITLPDRVILRTAIREGDAFACRLINPIESDTKACSLVPLSNSGLKVRSDPLVATVLVGEDVRFNCTAEADEPIESYVWSLKADAVIRFLSKPGRFRTDDFSRRLTLFDMELVDDMLWVKCSAEAQDGTMKTTISVTHVLTEMPTTINPSTSGVTKRKPQELPKATTTPAPFETSATTTLATNTSSDSQAGPTPLPITVISVAAAGGVIVVLIILAIVAVLVRTFRRSPKDVEGGTVNTSWVMDSADLGDDESRQPKRFGQKSRSSSKRFLYNRWSSKRRNVNRSINGRSPMQRSTSMGLRKPIPPPVIVPDPRGIYENIPKSGSTSSLMGTLAKMQQRLREAEMSIESTPSEASHNYETVKAEPPDLIRYKRPRPSLTPTTVGDDVGYASVEDLEEVPCLVYAELDLPRMALGGDPVADDFDPSILYAKVKK